MNTIEKIVRDLIGVLLLVMIFRFIVDDFMNHDFFSAISLLTIVVLTICFVVVNLKKHGNKS